MISSIKKAEKTYGEIIRLMVIDLYGAGSLSAFIVTPRKTTEVEETELSVTFLLW